MSIASINPDNCRFIIYMMRLILLISLLVLVVDITPVDATIDTMPSTVVIKPDSVRLVAVGDINLGRGVGNRIKKYGTSWLLENVLKTLSYGDICFGNLESPLTLRNNQSPGFVFRGDPDMAQVLADAGFDALALANNHALDQGRGGLQDTIDNLTKAGIAPVGAGIGPDEPYKAKIIKSNGLKIAFIGAQDVISSGTAPNMAGIARLDTFHQVKEVEKASKIADFVVVSCHWGHEYANYPEDYQGELAHKLVDAGADLILGHHPHVLQGIERYKGALIVYSLGNFAFDQRDEPTKRSIILMVDLKKDGTVSDPLVVPVRIDDYRPYIDFTSTGQKTLDELADYSRYFGIFGVTKYGTVSPEILGMPLPEAGEKSEDKSPNSTDDTPDENLPPGLF